MLGIPPITLLVVGAVGGVGAAGTFVAFHVAEKIGDELKPADLLPMPPPALPLPRFLYTKPHLAERLRKSVSQE